MGFLLAETWKRLSPDYFNYLEVAEAMIQVEGAMSSGRYRRAIVESFAWREIGQVSVGPRLRPPDARSHTFSSRTLLPGWGPITCNELSGARADGWDCSTSLGDAIYSGGKNG